MLHNLNVSLFTLVTSLIFLVAAPALAHQTAEGERPAESTSEQQAADQSFHRFITAIDVLLPRDEMEKRWPDAAQRLIDRAEDTEAPLFERWRATSILTNFEEPEVKDALIGLTGDSEVRVRSMAYYVLGTKFLSEGDDALFARLEAGLQDDSEKVRAEVIRSFGWTDNTRAHQVLRQLADSDDDKALSKVAQRSLQRLAQ